MRLRSRLFEIFRMALPITVGLSSTFIMVFVDLMMVGKLGSEALAAIGLAGFSYALFLSLVQGLAPAVQGLAARKKGKGQTADLCSPLNSGIMIAFMIGAPSSAFFYYANSGYFQLISSDPLVIEHCISYMTVLCFSMIGVGINESFEGFWNGVGKSKIFMVNVIFINLLNAFLNYMLIYGHFGAPALGTMGAGLATLISVYAGNLIYLVITLRRARNQGFLRDWPAKSQLRTIVSIAIPESIREFTMALGYVIFFWIVGKIGTGELAATNVIVRIYSLLNLFPMALGSVAATLVSGAIGQGDLKSANEYGWLTAKLGVVVVTLLALPLVLAPHWVLSFFIVDPNLVVATALPLQIVGITSGLTSILFIFAYTLITIGDVNRVLAISFGSQWLFFLPVVWFIGANLNYGLLEVWIVHTIYALLATAMIAAVWSGGRWKQINQVAS